MKNPRVSIIIATFNAASTLANALKSVKNQSYEDYECIVVDGGSKDDTIKIADEFSSQDSRFKYISEHDNGIYDAFNKGWKMAKGDWVMYLGADDFYFPDGISELLRIANDNTDIIYGDCELRFNKTCKVRGNIPLSSIGYKLPACHQSIAMRRSMIESLDGFNLSYKVYADLDIVQRGYLAGARFAETNAVISSFHVGGVSTDNLAASGELYRLIKTNGIVKYPLLKMVELTMITMLFKVYHLFK